MQRSNTWYSSVRCSSGQRRRTAGAAAVCRAESRASSGRSVGPAPRASSAPCPALQRSGGLSGEGSGEIKGTAAGGPSAGEGSQRTLPPDGLSAGAHPVTGERRCRSRRSRDSRRVGTAVRRRGRVVSMVLVGVGGAGVPAGRRGTHRWG
jgi:hypothetical protein